MTYDSILTVLKFGGPIVGLVSVMWSTTQKITYEAEDGVKRLTRQGRVLIAIIAVSGLISLCALGLERVVGQQREQREAGEAEKRQADLDRLNYPLRSIDARVAVSLNLDGLNLSAFWKDMAEELQERRLNQPHGDHRPVVALPRGRIGHYHDVEYSANRMHFTLTFVRPGGAFPSSATSARAEIRPLDVSANVTGPIILTLRLDSAEANVDRKEVTAVYHLEKLLEKEGIIESGEKFSLPDVDRLVPVLTFEPGSPLTAGGKRPLHTLVGVSYSLNGFERFDSSSSFRIGDKSFFILYLPPPRR